MKKKGGMKEGNENKEESKEEKNFLEELVETITRKKKQCDCVW